jgi:glycosyltransferase involved in cell wall biosynthesis
LRKTIIIDACSTSLGGGLTYLKEFLNNSTNEYAYFEIICSHEIAKKLPISPNIRLINHPFLNKGIFHRLIFQFFLIDKFINKEAHVLISLNGDYMGSFYPFIGVCQNMLLYEEEKTLGMSIPEKLKFKLLKYRQIKSFNRSEGVIFLSRHASKIVLPLIKTKNNEIINFGISDRFKNEQRRAERIKPHSLLYVSSIHTYKNQLNLIKAVEILIKSGINIELTLVGPIINKSYWNKIALKISQINNGLNCIKHIDYIDHDKIQYIYNSNDLFVFPSICENMPNILIEAIASKIPILSSNFEPMPEFLKDNALYFDPNCVSSIKDQIIFAIDNYDKLIENAENAYKDLKYYTWENNFSKTISFIKKTLNEF